MKVARYFLGVTIVVLSANATHATSLKLPLACTIIADVDSGKVLLREGTCDQRFSPASSFKFPLAIMGFDSGILTGPHDPTWELKAEFNASERDQNYKHVDPASWEKDSIVWFSQQLTTKLGKERFAEYVTKFDYGNTDLSGDPGRSNGLTHAWLLSSLRISPDEQIRFLRRFMTGKLPVSARAITLTKATIASYSGSEGWGCTESPARAG
jgi:beta-lactamase class D